MSPVLLLHVLFSLWGMAPWGQFDSSLFFLTPHVAHPSRPLGIGLGFSSSGDLPNGSWSSLHDSILLQQWYVTNTRSLEDKDCCFLCSFWSLPKYLASQECLEINEPPVEGYRTQQGGSLERGNSQHDWEIWKRLHSTSDMWNGAFKGENDIDKQKRESKGLQTEELTGARLRVEISWGQHLEGWGAGGREHWAGRWGLLSWSHGEGCFAPGRRWALFCQEWGSTEVFEAGEYLERLCLKQQGAGVRYVVASEENMDI